MSKTYLFCCHRCGGIFESTGDPDFCEDCRKVVYSAQKKRGYYSPAELPDITCGLCGKVFMSSAPNAKYCAECRTSRLREIEMLRCTRKKSKKKKHTQKDIADAAKEALERGMSYGQLQAMKSEGKI